MIPLVLALAAFHVPVSCTPKIAEPDGTIAAGVYYWNDPHILLTDSVCTQLDFARRGYDGDGPEGALQTLGHELAHSYGIRNEDGADCIGAILVEFVARKIGAPHRVAVAAWRDQAEARSAACRAWDRQRDSHG